ncbi:MAG: lipid-A-disaccharide synthase N-terminal domain-containing protein [Planctomycetota bacterium]
MGALTNNWFVEHLLDPLGLFGLLAQAVFMFRFVVQWFASERRRRSYVPVAFWYISLVGAAMTFVYALLRREPVFMLAQLLAAVIYVRNLVLIHRRRGKIRERFGEKPGTLLGEGSEEDTADEDAVTASR